MRLNPGGNQRGQGKRVRDIIGCLRRFSAYDLGVSFPVAVYWPPNEDMGDAIEVEPELRQSSRAFDLPWQSADI